MYTENGILSLFSCQEKIKTKQNNKQQTNHMNYDEKMEKYYK